MVGDAVRDSFTISYLVLFSFTVITLIEALTTDDVAARHIMNLETAVSIVAGFFYVNFAARATSTVQVSTDELCKTIMPYRYLDWVITTPMLLLVLMLNLSKRGRPVRWGVYAAVVALDFAMLGSGYLHRTPIKTEHPP